MANLAGLTLYADTQTVPTRSSRTVSYKTQVGYLYLLYSPILTYSPAVVYSLPLHYGVRSCPGRFFCITFGLSSHRCKFIEELRQGRGGTITPRSYRNKLPFLNDRR